MLAWLALAALGSSDCVTVDVADEALGARVRDELVAAVSLPLGAGCATTVTVDSERRLRVVASAVTPAVTFEEALSGSLVAQATHVAEVVRGVLLEVEERQRPPPVVTPPPPPIVPETPKPSPSRIELRAGAGPLFSQGGLSTGLAVDVNGAVRVGPVSFGVGAMAAAIDQFAAVSEGTVRARPVFVFASASVRVPSESALSVTAGIVAGVSFIPLEGLAAESFAGSRALGISALVGLDMRATWRIAGPFALWLGALGQYLFQPLRLDVVGRTVASLGPFIATPRAGVELVF